MKDKMKAAFSDIRAEDELKVGTTRFLREEIYKRGKAKAHVSFNRYATVFASCVVLILFGAFSYNAYFTTAAYVDLDVNPSIELELNRFDRVIGAYAYNGDGEELISNIYVKHKSYDDAITELMRAMNEHGYFQEGGLVSVTLQTNDKSRERDLLLSIQSGIEAYLTGHSAQLDVFPVSGETRSHSHELGLSPAKYIAIQELIEADPTASVESCRNHSISEIKELTREHGNHHGGMSSGGYYTEEDDDYESDAEVKQSKGHHGGGGGNKHHGGW